MKVLLLAAGRRVSLAKRFIAHGFDVFSYETELNCPISTIASIIAGKKWDDPEIKNHIIKIINNIKPDLILPLADKATTIISDIDYKGIITASKLTNSICLNKKIFEETFNNYNYYPNIEKNKPVILKPIFGANSKGLHKMSYDEFLLKSDQFTNYISQRLIDGTEISVDAYFNKHSKMVDGVPRLRVEVQGGEVCRSTTLKRDYSNILELTKQAGEKIGLVGPICAQFIVESSSSSPFIMEINSRFGGGVILSLEAGFDQIDLLKKEYIDKEECNPKKYNWKENFSMTRYFEEYFY